MAKKAKASKPIAKAAEVESYKHKEARRKNIPTAELQKLVPDDDKAIKKLRWPRNPDLDPQLVWRGKDVEPDPLEVDAPPIYIQEKIQPRAIIEDLRRQTKERRADGASQFDFFHDFNGLADPESKTEFYAHDQNWSNRMILGDSLLVMASLAEREGMRGKVQCIYFDPPYGIRFNSNWQPSTKSMDVRDGQSGAVSREPEVIRAFRDTWKDGIQSYMNYLRDRLFAARDLLADTGSIFVQIGEENVHLIRSLLDEVFGATNLCTSIVVSKTVGQTADILPNVADYVLWYAKDRERVKYRPLLRLKHFGGEGVSGYRLLQLPDGSQRPMSAEERAGVVPLPDEARAFGIGDLSSQRQGRPSGEGSAMAFPIRIYGREFRPSGTRGWSTTHVGIERLGKAARISTTETGGIGYVRYFDDFRAFPLTNMVRHSRPEPIWW
jgi:adenine-specific DNA-methyltransferase